MSAKKQPKRRRLTPAQRARQLADKKLLDPPPKLRRNPQSVRELAVTIRGRTYPIGANIDGDTPWEYTCDSAATITVPVRSPDGSLMRLLSNEALLMQDGASVEVDGVTYMVVGVSEDGTGLVTLTLEDQVAWRLRKFTRYMQATRGTVTRAGFVRRFVEEASRAPRAPMRAFIPEFSDVQPVAKPPKTTT